ncbi:SDR family oxidoreductase [Ramlibacter sp. 2FC]|uniref:SDR family NAD(P)-dependent oxidoreductase n=1 Tax=Ramlibacter sp. 2FC TaxID=2502188 RepID=UPI0010F4CDDF|nr:SDR family oxidoreductase [Ramlibacter sp. 2FC]
MKKPETCVVTGASAGIGKAIAQAVLATGQPVVGIDIAAPSWTHPDFSFFQADLTKESDVRQVAARIALEHDVTALVNNAGITYPGSLETQTVGDLEKLSALHLAAPMLLAQAFLPTLRSCGHGRIVNLSSRAALGSPERVAYSATKSGLIGMSRTLAMELAQDGVTVNVVAPGPIETELLRQTLGGDDQRYAATVKSLRMGRTGTPEEVAHAVMYFLSRQSGFTTGQVLYVCGGSSLGRLIA